MTVFVQRFLSSTGLAGSGTELLPTVAELKTSKPEQKKKADKASNDLITMELRMSNPVQMSTLGPWFDPEFIEWRQTWLLEFFNELNSSLVGLIESLKTLKEERELVSLKNNRVSHHKLSKWGYHVGRYKASCMCPTSS